MLRSEIESLRAQLAAQAETIDNLRGENERLKNKIAMLQEELKDERGDD